MGPLSEIVDFEDPDNKNLETFIIWKQIEDPGEELKQTWLLEFDSDLIPKNIKNYDKTVFKEFGIIKEIKIKFEREKELPFNVFSRLNLIKREKFR